MTPPRSRWILFWLLVWLVTCYYLGPAAAQQNGAQVVKILAIFDQGDLEMMTRVLHKTLVALNKENNRPQWKSAVSSPLFRRDRRDAASAMERGQLWNWTPPPPSTPSNSFRARAGVAPSKANYSTVSRASVGLKNARPKSRLKIEAKVLAAPWWINQTSDDLCALLLLHKPMAILALADEKVVLHVALAASAFQIPVIGIRTGRDLDDSSFQEVSRFYVGLNPSPHHLVGALHHLLSANHWFPLTLIVDDSPYAQKIRRVIQSVDSLTNQTLAGFDTKLTVVTMDRRWKPERILAQLSSIQQTTSLVIALCCDAKLTADIFKEAQSLNMLNGEWIWIALEETARRRPPIESQPNTNWSTALPVGLLGLVSQPTKLSKHSMKGSLAILHSALRSLPVDQVRSWDATFAFDARDRSNNGRGGSRAQIGDSARWNCVNPHSTRLSLSKKLHNEIRWRVKEALAGRLTYDGGGRIDTALQANFDVINLVPRGPFYPARGHVLPSSRHRRSVSSNSTVSPRQPAPSDNATAEERMMMHEAEDDDEEEEAVGGEDGDLASSAEEEADIIEEESNRDPWAQRGRSVSTLSPVDRMPRPGHEQPSGHVNDGNNGNPATIRNNGSDVTQTTDNKIWQLVGNVSGQAVSFRGVLWPGGGLTGPRWHSRQVYRVATVFSPPFVMETEVFNEDDESRCLTGVPCLRVATNDTEKIVRIFGDFERNVNAGITYNVTCCYGYSIDLMENVANDLDLKFQVYVVADGQCGAKRSSKWDGVVADLRSGAAHLSFAPLSVTSGRSEVIDFSIPFFYSGLSILEATKNEDVPLLAFLKPFGADLWIGIFISLNVTAVTVAIYEWLSPFGLNPWGRQRTKNFSLASALWVMWGLLFSHLVAFKAPKSWPNKFLINVWGGFSVIFLASYTANIAALFTGVFTQNTVTTFQDPRLLNQKVGTTRSSAAIHYANKTDRKLWEHLQNFIVPTLEEGVARLKDGRLDLLIGDTPILDYYRANDPGCTLRTVDAFEEDNYAVGISKGHAALQTSISSLISSYSASGYMDELRSKWYSSLPCFRSPNEAYRPQPLGVSAVAGVFILLGFGILAGCLILILEHLVYKYALPGLRRQPKGTIWRSPNMMFFSQKLYRFINCVELLSPHHAAKELMNSLRQGQITSLFQKSVKRENEQRRRRKSKAQFFEMIQEIRRSQKEEKDVDDEDDDDDDDDGDVEDEAGEEGEEEDDIDDDDNEKDWGGRNLRRKTHSEKAEKGRPDVIEDDSAGRGRLYSGRTEAGAVTEGAHWLDGQHSAMCSYHNESMGKGTEMERRARFQHTLSNATDPGSYATDLADDFVRPSPPVTSFQTSNIRRRTSVSVDALPGAGCITGPWRPRQNVADDETSPAIDDDFTLSSSSSSASDTDEENRTGAPKSSQRLSSAMVDRATLIKLTKEDLLLLWQAAEMEWVRKLGKTKNQRDALLLRLRRSKSRSVAPGRTVSTVHRHTHPPSTAQSSSLHRYGNTD